MVSGHRFTVRTIDADPRAAAIADGASTLGLTLDGPVHVADLVFLDGDLDDAGRARLADLLADPLLQVGSWSRPDTDGIEITLHPGVTDTAATAFVQAADQLGVPVTAAATGRRVELPPGTDPATAELLLRRLVANPVIEEWCTGLRRPRPAPGIRPARHGHGGRAARPRRRRAAGDRAGAGAGPRPGRARR